jgi:serine/threonine protein kinase
MKLEIKIVILGMAFANCVICDHPCSQVEDSFLFHEFEKSEESLGKGSYGEVKLFIKDEKHWALKRSLFKIDTKVISKKYFIEILGQYYKYNEKSISEAFLSKFSELRNETETNLYLIFQTLEEANIMTTISEYTRFNKLLQIAPKIENCQFHVIEGDQQIKVDIIIQMERIMNVLENKLDPNSSSNNFISVIRDQEIEKRLLLFCKLAKAFDILHYLNRVHGDIKPSNILFDNKLNPYLTDFGMSSEIGAKRKLGGSWGWIHPQKVADFEKSVDMFVHSQADDIYGFIVFLYNIEGFYIYKKPLYEFFVNNKNDSSERFNKVVSEGIIKGEYITDNPISSLADRNGRILKFVKEKNFPSLDNCETMLKDFPENEESASDVNDLSLLEFLQKITQDSIKNTNQNYAKSLGDTMLVYYLAACLNWRKEEKSFI